MILNGSYQGMTSVMPNRAQNKDRALAPARVSSLRQGLKPRLFVGLVAARLKAVP